MILFTTTRFRVWRSGIGRFLHMVCTVMLPLPVSALAHRLSLQCRRLLGLCFWPANGWYVTFPLAVVTGCLSEFAVCWGVFLKRNESVWHNCTASFGVCMLNAMSKHMYAKCSKIEAAICLGSSCLVPKAFSLSSPFLTFSSAAVHHADSPSTYTSIC